MEGINFSEDKTLIGMFRIPEIGDFYGKLIYRINEQCEIQIHFDSFNISDNQFNEILGKLSDENNKTYFVSIYNCEIHPSTISSADNIYIGYFDYALFSKQRHFNPDKDNLNCANIYINTWDEFCFPQGFKTHAEYKPKMYSCNLRNRMRISFNQDIRGIYLSKKNIFNDLFIY